MQHPHAKSLLGLTLLCALAVIVNPYAGIDIAMVGITLLIVGHVLFKEKLLLAFLILRPTIDIWRDVSLFSYREFSLNVNAGFAILFFAWSLVVLFIHRDKIFKTPLVPGFVVLSLIMLGSAAYSLSSLTTLIESIKFINIIAIFAIAYTSIKEHIFSIKELLLAIVISAIIPAAFGLWQIVAQGGISTFGLHGRIYGTFAHPNVFAFFIVSLLFLHIQFGAIKPLAMWEKSKDIYYGIYVLLFGLLIMTYTRAALVGFLIFLLVLGVLKYRKLLAVTIATVVGFYLLYFPVNAFLIRTMNYSLTEIPIIARVTSVNEDADSFAWRQALIRENIPIIYNNPVLGYGYGTFPLVWEDARGDQHFWDDSAEAHNDYLRFAVEIGVVGLVLYGALLLLLLYIVGKPIMGAHGHQEYLYLFAWVVSFVAMSFTDNMLHHTPVMWMMWAWWGAALASEYKGKELSVNFMEG